MVTRVGDQLSGVDTAEGGGGGERLGGKGADGPCAVVGG